VLPCHGRWTSERIEQLGLPDFLCIGAQKAGTSWLNNVLLEHPQIFMPPINELHFFDRIRNEAPIRRRQVDLARKQIRLEEQKGDAANQAYLDYLRHLLSFPNTTLEWYQAAYNWPVADGVMKGDITPSYLELPPKRVARARELLGPAKLILIIRRPMDRMLSQLRMWAARDDRPDVPQNDAEWMQLLAEMTEKSERGGYERGVRHWRAHFGAENLLVLPYGDMRSNPRHMIDRVENHLGIARHDGYTLLTTHIHTTWKMDVPEPVVAAIASLCSGEDDFLRQEFGEEFFEGTR
jgi:hypothetical protein